MEGADAPDDPLLVACLCAAWCDVCTNYRATFDGLADEFGVRARFVWVDIEDDEQALGGVDVVDFPTLLLASQDRIRFFGPVAPHAGTTRQLVTRALQDQLGLTFDPALAGLPARLRDLG